MLVLGLNCGHDSSCCLVRDGEVVADAQEERFVRIKHSRNVPAHAIQYCLEAAGLDTLDAVDTIAIGSRHVPPQLAAYLGIAGQGARRLATLLKPPSYRRGHWLGNGDKIVTVEHHLAHAASAHYTRDRADRCLVFTMDGIGDEISTAVWLAEGSQIRPLEKLSRGFSVGWAYSIVTEALGWWHGDGEGKTMGLAPYGDAEKCHGILDACFPVFGDPAARRPVAFGPAYAWNESNAVHHHFDEADIVRGLCEMYGREQVAAEAQRKLEECVSSYVDEWMRRTGITRAAFAGGVFLNVKLNQHLWSNRRGRMVEQHIFPNPGDSGLALGAALFTYHDRHPFLGSPLRSLSWGPAYEDEMIEQTLKDRKLAYRKIDDPATYAADRLAEGLIVGWFQGRMESGPRALGNRSILMSPLSGGNKDTLNRTVKYREAFRPFCPSLLWEKRSEYLVDARDEFFMITSFQVNDRFRAKMPAVVHVDGSVRPQMVRREMNEPFWRLIEHFGSKTGISAVLNTSLNIAGEPLANSPSDALRCFFGTGMDVLVMGGLVVEKPNFRAF